MSEIIDLALEKYKPVGVLLLFSGGHDSLCSTHFSAQYLNSKGIPFKVYHGNTGIGIRQTREYVYAVCKQYGWELIEGRPPAGCTYEELVTRWGFPGPTRQSHQIMYRRLKERALNRAVTYTMKSKPLARENVLLVTGVRKSESKIRMGYTDPVQKDKSKIWCNAIFYWTKEMCEDYMLTHSLPRNPVKDKICISGECLCGAFAGKEEWSEIKAHYPEAAQEIERLHKIATENGHPWHWASGPTDWKKEQASKAQLKMFMCVGCEEKNNYTEDATLS